MVGSNSEETASGKRQLRLPVVQTNGVNAADTGGTTGLGITPSWPTRNPLSARLGLLGSHPTPPGPVALQPGAVTLIVCEKPTPSEGRRTVSTVFWRS